MESIQHGASSPHSLQASLPLPRPCRLQHVLLYSFNVREPNNRQEDSCILGHDIYNAETADYRTATYDNQSTPEPLVLKEG